MKVAKINRKKENKEGEPKGAKKKMCKQFNGKHFSNDIVIHWNCKSPMSMAKCRNTFISQPFVIKIIFCTFWAKVYPMHFVRVSHGQWTLTICNTIRGTDVPHTYLFDSTKWTTITLVPSTIVHRTPWRFLSVSLQYFSYSQHLSFCCYYVVKQNTK